MRLAIVVSVIIWAVVISSLTGCGVMGVREADLWGAKFVFSEGLDFHVGANAIDKVEDKRGVSPNPKYREARNDF